jgi:demethylmenaquinone methyltransferase/2-methoxy-6-polyprenyl-1,4-benzoquinol methylase
MPKPIPENNHVQAMFGRIARRYDFLNHILSFGLDFYWWRQMARAAGAKPGMRILDAASGTGDSALALTKRGASVVMSDFAMPMLALGIGKYKKNTQEDSLMGAVGADAMNLPLKNSTFDAVAICYGIRNVECRPRAYAEFCRVLKPGGKLVILEFSRPRWAWLRWLYGIYSKYFLPALGGLASGDRAAYKYLHESIQRFPPQKELAQELENAGFINVKWQDLSFGIVALHTGTMEQFT